jgi:DNA-binding MarR family transcriptional regulator
VTSTDRLSKEAGAYLGAAFDINVQLKRMTPQNLPHFLVDRYLFWEAELLGHCVLFMQPKERGKDNGDITKHQLLLRKQKPDRPVILLLEDLPPALRTKLIARKVAFLYPKHQIYVPELVLALSERSSKPKPLPPEQLSPTAQLIIIAALHDMDIDSASLGELSNRFDLALMSVSRAFDELEELELIATFRQSRQRRLRLRVEGGDLWEAAKKRLSSPVRKCRTVRTPTGRLASDKFVLAGLSALSNYTMLAPPRIDRLAVAAISWKELVQEFQIEETWPGDDDAVEIETWRYDPRALNTHLIADRISLYLSVRDDPDERVALAAEQLLEPLGW